MFKGDYTCGDEVNKCRQARRDIRHGGVRAFLFGLIVDDFCGSAHIVSLSVGLCILTICPPPAEEEIEHFHVSGRQRRRTRALNDGGLHIISSCTTELKMDERGGLNVSRPEYHFILRKPSPALFLPTLLLYLTVCLKCACWSCVLERHRGNRLKSRACK